PIARRASEPALVALLTHRTPALVRAAAALLARHGTDAAVTPLRDAIPRGLGGDRDLRRELERALADVADRNGLGRGQLSLATPQGGELSHARAEAGALSEPPRDDAAHAPTTADRTTDDET
ncbi:hypothetical protein L6R52_22575, partial [Myxococcota bacterium]|nr:hypothetical protein [Myxococcota bacterium]